MADNAGKKTFRAAVFPENEHCMGISEQTVPECGIDDTSDRFLAADMENSPGLCSIHWKRKSSVHRKKNKNKQNQQADRLQQGLPVVAGAWYVDLGGTENQCIEYHCREDSRFRTMQIHYI